MNRLRKIRHQAGLTILELIVVVTLVGIIAGVTARMFVWGVDMFDFVSSRKDVLQSARFGMDILVRDLRTIIDSADISVANASAVSFTNFDGETFSYGFSAGTLNRNGTALIDGLTGFHFTFYDVDGSDLGSPVSDPIDIWKIDISMDATLNSNPFHLESSVIPRSFH